jgi:hypothetical protein
MIDKFSIFKYKRRLHFDFIDRFANIYIFAKARSKQIRTVWNEFDQKWYFSVQDVVQLLTETTDVNDYIKKMKKRDPALNSNWGTICPWVEMNHSLWLAKVGSERLEEIEYPEIAPQ